MNPIVENANAAAATLTVNNATSKTFAGVLQDGGGSPLSVIKIGSGILTLGGFNTFTGGLTVGSGIVALNAPGPNALASACPVTINSGGELDINQTDNVHDCPMSVSGVVNITGGGNQHFNLLTLSGATIETSGSSIAADGQANYALDSAAKIVDGTSHSILAASTGIHLNVSPTFNVASTGDPADDLIISASLRDSEGGTPSGLTKAGPTYRSGRLSRRGHVRRKRDSGWRRMAARRGIDIGLRGICRSHENRTTAARSRF